MRTSLGAYLTPGNSVLPAYTPIAENVGGEAEPWTSHSSQIIPSYTGVQELPEEDLRRKRWDQSQTLPRYTNLGETATERPKLDGITLLAVFGVGLALGYIFAGTTRK